MLITDKLGEHISLREFYLVPDSRPTRACRASRWNLGITFASKWDMQSLMGDLQACEEVILAVLPEKGIAILGLSQGAVTAAAISSELLNCPTSQECWEEVGGCVGLVRVRGHTVRSTRIPFTRWVINPCSSADGPLEACSLAWQARLLFEAPPAHIEVKLGENCTTLN